MSDNCGMYLLSRETVFVEMAELARNKMAEVMKVDPRLITVGATVGDGGDLGMEFSVSARAVDGLESEHVKFVMEKTYRVVKEDLEERLVGIQMEWRMLDG